MTIKVAGFHLYWEIWQRIHKSLVSPDMLVTVIKLGPVVLLLSEAGTKKMNKRCSSTTCNSSA